MNKTNHIPETLAWQALSHIKHQRSILWYFVFTLVCLSLIGYAVYTRSVLTFVTFLLITFIILFLSWQPEREVTYKVTKAGIAVGTVLYPYKIIKKFWIIYTPEVKALNFETSAYLNNRITLQLGKQDPIQLKFVLSRYLEEDLEQEESISETLARRLKI